MIGDRMRPYLGKVINPIASGLLRGGVTPNMVTVFGTMLNIVLAIVLIGATGHLISGAIVLGLCAFVDLVDGAMARQIGRGTPYGAVLDATLDRIADGAIIGSILWWAIVNRPHDHWLIGTTLVTLVFSGAISYAKARAEASGIPVTVGLVERPERLTIALVGIGFTGLGIELGWHWLTFSINVAMWILTIGSIYTVVQRLRHVAASPKAREDLPVKPDHTAPEGTNPISTDLPTTNDDGDSADVGA